ncbi:MAG: ferrous iron transport protein A [Clostridia bacterium]|nr:ferrous iron transport protein A [Clostridia bacterium]
MFLSEIESGKYCVIVNVLVSEKLRGRLFELGVKKGEKIKVVRESYKNSPIIILVKNTFFAIREEDANKIEVKE